MRRLTAAARCRAERAEMALKPCLDCGDLSEDARCPLHRRHWERRSRPSASQRGYTSAYRRVRQRLIQEHITKFGLVCPGFGDRLPHTVEAHELTVDHLVSLSEGGRKDVSNLFV